MIQSEKMASLGNLQGIAHEIQNPLNFVNNFSEVNNELIEELKIKNEKLKIEDGEVNELLDDIAQNLEKINSWQTCRCDCERHAATQSNQHWTKRTYGYQ